MLLLLLASCIKDAEAKNDGTEYVPRQHFIPAMEEAKPEVAPNLSDRVYVCDSKHAKKYHLTEDCQGLKKCIHQVIKLSREQALNRGLGLCGHEK